ncbi:hypothetical protein GCM10007358_07010 [Phocicoccus schoeneichii]|uniref:Teichoic acids export ATP-binding protein TagH n=1 Tax=Phocicoccus schoeneichii TaxID=1812261 RepID=A0A6V7R867_9BACL|nr:teichoic acids export ABC transporter ATP-binding subunit TagH [Jeotgalicoccus schoeneichii]GGH50174.1 hypothetical protein GCM10007358_07010 [Jeotgalicoccus schoeneichii]CAD2073002.1 Teichoic acids export ATP-binding protein TagH [Jeotgalicoccus schoeneichii]
MSKVIEVKNVSKRYKLYRNTKERLLSIFNRDKYGEDFYALDNVNFEAVEGDVVGFIGTNGSGKSTLSNIISGIVPETSGEVHTRGSVMLIAVAAGLNNDLTGRENIELKCLMLGFSKQEIKELEPEIIEFSELGSFIDQPVKSYSSGMKSRLGFAISVSVDPDILIIDEALSVGDRAFADKSLKKMKEFKELGKTMIFVSHSIGQMKMFCDKILWLEFGRVKAYGEVNEVLGMYEAFLNKWQNMSKKEREDYKQRVLSEPANSEAVKNDNEVQVYSDEALLLESSDDYTTVPTSRLAHIRGGQSKVYKAPNSEEYIPSDEFKNHVYHVTKEANFRFDKYFLLSTEKSSETGTIGWMKEQDVQSHLYVEVDSDEKEGILKGIGSGSKEPWGGKKQLAYKDLAVFEGQKIKIVKTVLIGKNIWYQGTVEKGKLFWLHVNQLENLI